MHLMRRSSRAERRLFIHEWECYGRARASGASGFGSVASATLATAAAGGRGKRPAAATGSPGLGPRCAPAAWV
eukprot:6925102-Pyramimonas_sp.AAC.1